MEGEARTPVLKYNVAALYFTLPKNALHGWVCNAYSGLCFIIPLSLSLIKQIDYPIDGLKSDKWNYRKAMNLNIKLPINYNVASSTLRRLVREEYIKQQNGKCYHCKEPLNIPASKEFRDLFINKNLFPKGFFDHPIHLHHDHNTGMTIGAVHCDCNAVLWQYHGE